MFCYKCGFQIPDDAQFCSKCGTEQKANAATVATKKNGEYSNEALKIYFTNLLTLECIKNKLQNDLNVLKKDIETNEKNNFYKRYHVYTDGNIPRYLHFWYDGVEVKFAACRRGGGEGLSVNGYYIEREYDLHYGVPGLTLHTEWFSVEDSKELFESIWQYKEYPVLFSFLGPSIKSNPKIKELALNCYVDFKEIAPIEFKKNIAEIDKLKNIYIEMDKELNKANQLLDQAYDVNIVPKQFRNLYAVYYLTDFINTSNESLSTALLNYNLEIIKEKLDEIIEQQQEIIINQALMMAQNEKIMRQNEQQLRHLASIEQNTDRAAQYAQIASNNAEACAWIGIANYISK